MADNIVTVLNTTVGDNGAVQTMDFSALKQERLDGGTRFFISIGAGDTVVIEGKAVAADAAYLALNAAITASGVYDIKLSPVWRARRSVDGGGADSTVRVINLHNIPLVAHA